MSERDTLPRLVEHVTFAQLRTFACAARAGSFAKAAQMLDISQPAVSEQIRTLEERLGRHLFERRRGSVPVLTEEGEEALELVQTILTAGRSLFERRRRPAEKTALRIGIGPFLRDIYLKALLPRIHRAYPGVEIHLQPTSSSAQIVRQIEDGEVDLAVYALNAREQTPPHARQICELPPVMVAPPGTRARLSAGDCSLDDFQYIFLGHREAGAHWAKGLLRGLGLAPRTEPLFIEFVDAVARMVEEGQGIGYLMAYSVADEIAHGRIEPLDIVFPPMRRLIGRSPHAPRVAREVEEMLCDALTV